VRNQKFTGIEEAPVPMAWFNILQEKGSLVGDVNVELRVRGDGMSSLPTIQKVISEADPNMSLLDPVLQREQFEETISDKLMFARLAEFFGGLAILLVATGLYETLVFRVNRRSAEIGVRMALGARREQVVWLILKTNLVLTAAGVLVGFPLAIVAAKGLSSTLYGVGPFEPSTYSIACVCLLVVAIASSAIPALRAASIDPAQALRAE
jgi:ABC-type antimicrobial peptide transport system permease subunit